MITLYDAGVVPAVPDLAGGGDLPLGGTLWVDLIDPTDAEDARVERATGLVLPSAHQLSEIETSSRLVAERDALVMSTPVLFRDEEGLHTLPVGFVLGRRVLVTIRGRELRSFTDFVRGRREAGEPLHDPADALLGLLDAVIARLADGMEAVAADLDRVSKETFGTADRGAGQKPVRVERRLRSTLRTIGRGGDATSQARDSLLGLSRLLGFLANRGEGRLSPEQHERIDVLRADVAALGDYETRLTDQIQFLLDSTLGFISVEQNRAFKLLAVASLIGIPPTFVVGLYGMNFKFMPELEWHYGYAWGLFLVVLSAVVPVVWLKLRGWI